MYTIDLSIKTGILLNPTEKVFFKLKIIALVSQTVTL